MVKTGIVSATFRQLSAEEILKLALEAKLDAIEWSSDVHLLPGDKGRAKQIKKLCTQHQISICGYASYYRLGEYANPISAFGPILETAQELGAPIIRIWAGTEPSADLSPNRFLQLIEEARLLIDAALEIHAHISFEYHQNTLTDTKESTMRLLEATPGSKTHWQVSQHYDMEENTATIPYLAPHISTIHVQQCAHRIYYPLDDGRAAWSHYFKEITKLPGDHHACLEFVKDGSIPQFLEDARTLSYLIREAEKGGTYV